MRKKPIALSEVEHEEDKKEDFNDAVSRLSRAVPLLAALSARVARRDAVAAALPKWTELQWKQFQEPTVFFSDSFQGSALEWLAFDPIAAEGYACAYHALNETMP